MCRFFYFVLGIVIFNALLVSQGRADPSSNIEALSKETQNPLSTLSAIPFQNNTQFRVGPHKRTVNVLDMQPFFPVALTPNYNMIVRSVIPITYSPSLVRGMKHQFGLQDTQLQLFFTGSQAHNLWGAKFSIGIGPNFYLPTATKFLLGQHRWALGPSAVFVFDKGPWVVGGLLTSTFSVLKRTSKRGEKQHISNSSFEPIINYNIKDGWALSSNPTISMDWREKSGHNLTVPLGGGVSRTFLVGKQAVMMNLSGYYNVVRPHESERWILRSDVMLLFPKKTPAQGKK